MMWFLFFCARILAQTHLSVRHQVAIVFIVDRLYFTEGVRAKVYFKAVPSEQQDDLTYLRVEETKMDFSVKDIRMGVDNVANGNPVIRKIAIPDLHRQRERSLFIFDTFQKLPWICSSTATRRSCWRKWSQHFAISWIRFCIRSSIVYSSAFRSNTFWIRF